ncbi:2-nitropropane dioxygenase [Flagelloscypha sp. PMI_526]|nr:2-nitropropane dioxygenase [Flagelloscypha sp. PMI_526]
MASIKTPLTRLLGTSIPIVCPPMAGGSGGLLASRVSLAGGFGFMAAGYDTPQKIRSEITLARNLFQIPAESALPIGVGFLVWQLEKAEDGGFPIIDIVLQENVRAIWFSFGKNLGKYIKYVRDRTESSANGSKPLIFVPVSSADEAAVAVEEWKVDAIVAQGIESGGHGFRAAAPLLSLLSSILERIQDRTPVLAAGGLATGTHVAAMLTAGASGASVYTNAQQKVLLEAKSEEAVRTMAFDHARGTVGWPEGVDGRGNHTDLQLRFAAGVKVEDPKRMLVWSGTGVGHMKQVLPAADVLQELATECMERLKAAAGLIITA